MSALDWPGLMRAGMTGLGLQPAQFWALSPAELGLMLGQGGQAPVLTRAGLDALQAAWPDQMSKPKEVGDGTG